MELLRKWLGVLIIAFLLGGGFFQAASYPRVSAQAETPTAQPTDGPKRVAKITVNYTRHKWWMNRWSNNLTVCSFFSEHEGLPTLADVEGQCDQIIYEEWKRTTPCNMADLPTTTQCPGFYLQLIESTPLTREIELELPDPTVWVSVNNCNPQPPDTFCTTLPNLVLTGEEPLPNETIIAIHGSYAGVPFSCQGGECVIPLQPTGMEGISVEFWADSSYGDSTEHFTAQVRLIPWGGFMNPEEQSSDPTRYYVDVISSRWKGAPVASCAETWQSFPDIGGPPPWLMSPESAADLQTDVSFYYLSGAMITYGVVDASSCLDGGLQAPNIASPCGVEAARPQMQEWQNHFDSEILDASNITGIPAQLLKNVFMRESQLWPGIFRTYRETGLGQLTDNGADTILLWNPDFFHQFCPLVLHQSYCDLGYGNLHRDYPALTNMLRGALVRKVDASCPNCPAAIDVPQANYSVRVFAEGMQANCEQVGRIITNLTTFPAGRVSSYEDLWRFTLINYNAGPGCLSNAMQIAWNANQTINWQTVTTNLEPACQLAIGYVEDITQLLKATPTPTVWLPFEGQPPTPDLPRVLASPTPSPTAAITGPTLAPTATPTPDLTQSPTSGPSPTTGPSQTPEPTNEDYPYPAVTDTPEDYESP